MIPETEVGFRVRPLPACVRLPNALAARLEWARPRMTPEDLVRNAVRASGLPDRLPAHVGLALEVFCRSLRDEARQHWFGRVNNASLVVTGLATLLQVEQAFRDDPTLNDEPLLDPIVVTGLPRSGTTFLHRLLCEPSGATGLALYRHVYPLPRRPFDYRRWDVALQFEPWRVASKVYNLDAIHFVRPDLPDECNFGMRVALRSMIYWSTAPVYSYLHWLLAQDLRESYQIYRKILQVHQRQLPGQRLVLKCPHHLAWLPALVEALPEAHLVQTHRDPVEAVPSECSLILALQALSTDELDWRRTVEHNQLKVRTFAERAVAFASTDAGQRVAHIRYTELLTDPVGLVARLHERFGLPWSEEDAARLRRFVADNRQHKHGRHRYTLKQFGLSAAAISADFAAYRQRFLED